MIVAYRAKPGQFEALVRLASNHVPFLRDLGLATDRPEIIMKAKDDVIVEVFEWKTGAIVQAHEHPKVAELWQKFAEICDYITLDQLDEAKQLFAGFEPLP